MRTSWVGMCRIGLILAACASPRIALGQAPAQKGRVRPPNVRLMLDRLAGEAGAFERVVQQVTGQETLHQRAMSAPPKFKPRIGEAAKKPPQGQWRDREIVSLYAISKVGNSLYEIRQVIFVDGKRVQDEQRAQKTLMQLLSTNVDQQKFAAVKQLEKYTLNGAATDFGPLILLFSHGGAERYEFDSLGPRQLGTVPASAYHFRQLDGSEGFTVFNGLTQQLKLEGEVWISDVPEGPLRITLEAFVPGSDPLIREEAEVDYARSPLGALLPSQIEQRELHDEETVSENIFTYGNFQRLADR